MHTPIHDRRKHKRYECNFPVRVITETEEISAVSVDVSMGGIRILGKKPLLLPIGHEVTLRFMLPGVNQEIEVRACVRMHLGYFYGLQFVRSETSDAFIACITQLDVKNEHKNTVP